MFYFNSRLQLRLTGLSFFFLLEVEKCAVSSESLENVSRYVHHELATVYKRKVNKTIKKLIDREMTCEKSISRGGGYTKRNSKERERIRRGGVARD